MGKRKRRRWKWLLLLVLVAGGIAYWILRPRARIEVYTARAERVPELKAIVTASGEVQAHESVDIQTEIAGVIVEIAVEEGDRVEKGQLLLRIDPSQTEADVQAARAQYAAAQADLKGMDARIAAAQANVARDKYLVEAARVDQAQAEVSAAQARSVFERTRKLHEKGLVPDEEYETAEANARLADARVDAAKAKVQQMEAQQKASELALEERGASRESSEHRAAAAKATLERSEDLLEKTTMHAPLSGIVTHLHVEVGERAVPGILSSPQATLMTIADLSALEAEIDVDETDIVRVSLDDPAEVIVDALEDTPFAGKVSEIANAPTGGVGAGSQEGKDFEVVVRLEGPTAALSSLRPGMSCEARIRTETREKVLVIPIQSLVMREVFLGEDGGFEGVVPLRPAAGGKGKARAGDGSKDAPRKRGERQGVFIVNAGHARFRPVETGILGEMNVEVVAGLEEGDTVIVGPQRVLRKLEDGAEVRARPRPWRGALDEDEEEGA